jgi:hypothetical protein
MTAIMSTSERLALARQWGRERLDEIARLRAERDVAAAEAARLRESLMGIARRLEEIGDDLVGQDDGYPEELVRLADEAGEELQELAFSARQDARAGAAGETLQALEHEDLKWQAAHAAAQQNARELFCRRAGSGRKGSANGR